MERHTPSHLSAEREKEIYKVTLVGSIVNLLLLVFKFVAGFAGRSSAMIADAVHSLSDFSTDLIVLIFVRIAGKPQDKGHDYGHGKFETLATALIGIALFAVGVGICWNAVLSVIAYIDGTPLEAPRPVAFIAAIVSIVFKEILYQYTVRTGRKFHSQAVVANAWHHRSDAFSSIGTALGIGGAIMLGEQWRVLDPLAAIVVSMFIMKVAVQIFMPCMDELLEKSLPEETEQQIEQILLSLPEVSEPHHLRTRRIGNYCAIEVHLRMDGRLSLNEAHAKTQILEQRIKEFLGEQTLINIHVEPKK